MTVKEAIDKRRAYRSFIPVEITDELIKDLAQSAQLFCSCFNNQPWRYVFVYEPEMLKKMHTALSQGNEWAQAASMIIAVLSKPEFDCVIKDRKYYLFDTGMATAAIILRATELGLVAHPIAGFSPRKTKEILEIPNDMEVITLVIVGKHSEEINPVLSDKQRTAEKKRPERISIEKFVYLNRYKENNTGV
ncbi:nitroreductase [candidate division TA06 bacterium DG_78]|uniref:Nitroreductase n=1 Tax=candidate division TA06 bacterium DG_78 TaxID=1703772 RepID=A0A0S7YB99_UNCT6|nr:MAG: nitroreductase [candidate division TA06 bacterium DG_78]